MLKYIGVVGSRGILPNIDELIEEEDIDIDNTVFVSGGCKNSPDESIAKYCKENKIPIQEYLPKWNEFPKQKYGNQAFFYRNEQIVLTCDIVYIYWNNQSKGSKMVVELCKKHNKKYKIIRYN